MNLTHARKAVNAYFFLNGMIIGHWAPKIPIIVDRLDISESILGKLIILFGIGAIVALVVGAWLVTKIGSQTVTRYSALLLSPALLIMTAMPTVATTGLAFIWLGVFLGAMDNAMNANGVGVEVALKKPVMSSYHGFWSLGGVFGGLTGGALIAWFGEFGHSLIVTVFALCICVWAWPKLMPDDHLDAKFEASEPSDKPKKAFQIPKVGGIYLLGLITMLSFAPEGTVIDWSALYLKQELGSPLIVSGYAVAAFSFTMALMRFLGDGIRSQFGDRKTFILSAVVSSIGLILAGSADDFYSACFGFLIAGLGMANVVPVLFSAGGKYPGLRPSVGIAVITSMGYAGLLFIPALVGVIAEVYSLSIVYVGWGFIVMTVALLGFVLPHIDGGDSGESEGDDVSHENR